MQAKINRAPPSLRAAIKESIISVAHFRSVPKIKLYFGNYFESFERERETGRESEMEQAIGELVDTNRQRGNCEWESGADSMGKLLNANAARAWVLCELEEYYE